MNTDIWTELTLPIYHYLLDALIEDLDALIPSAWAGLRSRADLAKITPAIELLKTHEWLVEAISRGVIAVRDDEQLLYLTPSGMLTGAAASMSLEPNREQSIRLGATAPKDIRVEVDETEAEAFKQRLGLNDVEFNKMIRSRAEEANMLNGVLLAAHIPFNMLLAYGDGQYLINDPDDEDDHQELIERLIEIGLLVNTMPIEHDMGRMLAIKFERSFFRFHAHERRRLTEAGWRLADLITYDSRISPLLTDEQDRLVRLLHATDPQMHLHPGDLEKKVHERMTFLADAFEFDMDDDIDFEGCGWRMLEPDPVNQVIVDSDWVTLRFDEDQQHEYRLSEEGMLMLMLLEEVSDEHEESHPE